MKKDINKKTLRRRDYFYFWYCIFSLFLLPFDNAPIWFMLLTASNFFFSCYLARNFFKNVGNIKIIKNK